MILLYMTKDDQIILDYTILKHHIVLVNIYGPNTDILASPFFESMFEELGKLPNKIENLETQISLLQNNVMTNCSENTVSQIKNLKTELNSTYDTKVKMKMFSNRK